MSHGQMDALPSPGIQGFTCNRKNKYHHSKHPLLLPPLFTADHGALWYRISLGSVGVNYPTCFSSHHHPGHWQGTVRSRKGHEHQYALLRNSETISVLSTLFSPQIQLTASHEELLTPSQSKLVHVFSSVVWEYELGRWWTSADKSKGFQNEYVIYFFKSWCPQYRAKADFFWCEVLSLFPFPPPSARLIALSVCVSTWLKFQCQQYGTGYVVWQWPLTIGVAVVTFYNVSSSPLVSQHSLLIITRNMGQEHPSWDKESPRLNATDDKYMVQPLNTLEDCSC